MRVSRSLRWFTAAPLLFGFGAPAVAGQAQEAAQKPAFDVASVKPVTRPVAPHGVGLLVEHGTLRVDAGALRQIIGLAYGVQRVMVHGCPAWCDEDLFDIDAKTDRPKATRDDFRLMVQSLLEDRFKLVTHRETREVPGYELMQGKNGSTLAQAKEEAGPTNVFTPQDGGLGFHNMNLAGLVNYLANALNQPVRDKTGLTALYNFTLRFQTPEAGAAGPQAVDFASIVKAAVEEQLGLKLQPRKVAAEILVIDRAEHPAGN